MAEEDSEHLGIMAYAAKFINLKPVNISAFSKYEQKEVWTLESSWASNCNNKILLNDRNRVLNNEEMFLHLNY